MNKQTIKGLFAGVIITGAVLLVGDKITDNMNYKDEVEQQQELDRQQRIYELQQENNMGF